jgi:NADH-quinone oxidoreductase subunit L
MAMGSYLYLIPMLPLLAFVINLLFGRITRDHADWIATPAVFVSFLLSLLVMRDIAATGQPMRQDLYTWMQSGDFHIGINLFVDQLTAVMLVVVTSVGFLVHFYSRGYMHGDPGFARFFAYLPFFVFSMLMLVLADNFLLLFFFWEGVGLASYLLIGFWFTRRSASSAAQKAFIVNRVGDLAFGLGLIWIFYQFGTLDMAEVFAQVPAAPIGIVTGIALLLFGGACGKSAQFPLHVWLPDAMEGPTPVSALIHAATMVTAGIYLVVRTHIFYEYAPTALLVVALIGGFTAFMAATIGMAQDDIKRVIAYSTLSQLGYMAMGAGVGAFIPAIFHLVTHAFFKACLFLGAGSVIHGMHEEQNMQNMGGLRRYMPVTFWTFVIASFANAGLIPFAGFWSKDEIILSAWITHDISVPVGKFLSIVGLVTAFFTAYYMFRVVFLVFVGEPRYNPAVIRPHESPPSMTIPLVLLAIPSAILGLWIGLPPDAGRIHTFLEPVFEAPAATEGEQAAALYQVDAPTTAPTTLAAKVADNQGGEEPASLQTTLTFAALSTVAVLAGIFVAWMVYVRGAIARPEAHPSALYQFLRDKWRWDELYNNAIVTPLRELAYGLWRVVDTRIIDGAVNGVGYGIGAASQRLRRVQTGLVTNYALAIALGMVVLLGIYLGISSSLFR